MTKSILARVRKIPKKGGLPQAPDHYGVANTSQGTMMLACLVVFMAQTATTIYLPSLPAVMRDLDISKSMAELSISLFVMGAAAPVPLFGIAADRFGRKVSLVHSLLVFVACSLLLTFTATQEALLVLRFFQGVGAGGSAIIGRIIIRDRWTGDELAKRLSVLSMAFITALGGGQFIGGLIGRFSSWESGFAIMALTGLGALILAAILPMQGKNRSPARQSIMGIYLNIVRNSRFLIPTCVGGLGFAITVTLQQMSPFLFQKHFGVDVVTHGNLGLLIGAAYFSGAVIVSRTVSRLGGVRLLLSGAWIMALTAFLILLLWLAGILKGFSGLAIFTAVYCTAIFGQAILFPNSMALAVSVDKQYGTYSMALCGFLQQSIAGGAASILSLCSLWLSLGTAWAFFIVCLSLLSLLLAIQNSRMAGYHI